MLDCLAIILISALVSKNEFLNITFLTYSLCYWIVSSYFTGYYKVYRYTRILTILLLYFKQTIVFVIGFFAFFGFFKEGFVVNNQFNTLLLILFVTALIKITFYYALKIYRNSGKNYRKIIVLGHDNSTKEIIDLFKKRSKLGYRFLGFFTNKSNKNKVGTIRKSFQFMIENEVDEVYVSLDEMDKNEIKEISKFTASNDIALKLVPESSQLFSKSRNIEYYDDTLMVLNVKKLPFEYKENYFVKRVFDIIFSFTVCVLVMTWLVPLLWILIRIESKGSPIFKQNREGLNGNHFVCYKFRSMKLNDMSDKIHATENDARVTKIGSFIRKTSIDELPQFFNVLKGDMSVVGPRPHVEALSIEYQKEVDDYLKRHAVKPGITGLAQVSGYRGEIKKKSDIKNRVRLDIFYIENWSFLLDVKIILMTVFNVFKGEDKAY